MKNNVKIGKIGEEKACEYLKKHDYHILERNYLKKFGEIDIIAKQGKMIIFFEVKTLFIRNSNLLMPEDNFTTQKFDKVKKTCEFFIAENQRLINEDMGWRLDLIAIELFLDETFSIRHYENV